MRWGIIIGSIVLGLATPRSLHAQPVAPDYGKAYSYAMRCFVASGIALPKPDDDPDGEATKAVRAHARKAFDVAYVMGGKLGYSARKIAADFDRAQGMEMRLMMQNSDYLTRTKSDCVKLGLM